MQLLKDPQRQRVIRSFPILGLLLAGIIGAAIVLVYTQNGPGLSGDSVDYIWGAKSLLAGKGYSYISGGGELSPIIGFPPMTSVSLALVGISGADLVSAGRWLNALFFAANIFLAGYLTLQYTRSPLAGLIASGLLVSQSLLVRAHAWVMSEGLFILLMLLSFWALLHALDRGKYWVFALSGILAALAALTRYVGIMILPAGVLAIALSPLFLRKAVAWKQRINEIIVFSMAGLLPVALWFGRNELLGNTAANRQPGFYPMPQDLWAVFVDTMLSWLYLPEMGLKWRVRILVFCGVMAGIVAAFIFREYRQRLEIPGEEIRRFEGLPWLVIFYVPLYILLIWVNSSFLDSTTSYVAMRRYLMPAFVAWAILMVCTLYRLSQGRREKGIRVALIGVAIALLLAYGVPTAKLLVNIGFEFGYMDNVRAWEPEAAVLRNLEVDRPLITNNPQLLYLLCERYSYTLPSDAAQTSGNVTIENEATLQQRMLDGAALVVFLNQGDPAQNQMADRLIDGMGLVLVGDASHMRVFGVQP